VTDLKRRARALDVSSSFIVQAPAGSGKTELLIQRYLALLARVELPEQVLAITFTRKAAAEMRHRILAALGEAVRAEPPAQDHRQKTFELATAVIRRSQSQGWELIAQPQRLRIETLDAMNAWLAQHLLILSGGLGGAAVAENPSECYELAVRRTLECLGSGDDVDAAVTELLRASDNNALRLQRLLVETLPTRDQWLPYLAAGDDIALRATLESALRRLVVEALDDVSRTLPQALKSEIESLLRHAAAAAADTQAAAIFAPWRLSETVLEVTVESLDAWRAVPELLLTQGGSWRKQHRGSHGFGPDHSEQRDRLKCLIADHVDDDDLRLAIAGLRNLPSGSYGEHEWRLIAALRRTLYRLAAELKVVFTEQHRADFVEIALAAQQALGRVDQPSELLLALDRRIQHILVDEFQDTSHMQLRLLKRLTEGWEAGDGRTLFLVGDPMQSIYRFRHADMSLFLKTKSQGLGGIRLESLLLDQNFRSAPAVVDWVNRNFARIFPAEDDMGAGAARFHPCVATHEQGDAQGVVWHGLRGRSNGNEIECVAELLRSERAAHPNRSVAVLVRSRSHLIGLQERLQAAGLPVHAVELEAPNQRQIVQDLIGLTCALSHLGDRLAWLAVLRAPWCGLTWQDLDALCGSEPDRAIWDLMRDAPSLARLSDDGRQRVDLLRTELDKAFDLRAAEPFEVWVESTWLALGGADCLADEGEAASAERYFATLGNLVTQGSLDDPARLEESFTEPYGQGDAPRETGVEIMTIHRAKGLEFDTVILLGLGRQPRRDSAKALYWLERTAADGSEDLLLGPLTPVTGDASAATALIKAADAIRDRAESMRLLYVAATRTRQRLHLVAELADESEEPPKGSLLEFLWPDAAASFPPSGSAAEPVAAPLVSVVPSLRRLRRRRPPIPQGMTPEALRPEFLWAGFAAVQVGTVVHGALQQIAADGLREWSQEAIVARRDRFRRQLALLGVDRDDLPQAAGRVERALCSVLDDRHGRWLLEPHHQARSEFALTVHREGRLEHLRIDRTFVDDDGVRWIVDYKTSVHEGADVEAFLDSEVERYRSQLQRYAAAMAAFDRRPIRLGLYFPLLQAFRSWPATFGPAGDGTPP
jgi:ATP-dependent helicase/nuclease subunit A